MSNFLPVANATPSVGLVLRTPSMGDRLLRVTHIFGNSIYAMWVGTPASARSAKRPKKFSHGAIHAMASAEGAEWGRLKLPGRLSTPAPVDSDDARRVEANWELIRPLIDAFDLETNLSRDRYEVLIRQHAAITNTNFLSLKRLLHRYFYFGRSLYALRDLAKGPAPATNNYKENPSEPQKRRGRSSILTDELGKNNFIVSAVDIEDMGSALKQVLRRGPSTLANAHNEYIAHKFSKRYPQIYAEYMSNERQLPVTYRQFGYYMSKGATLEDGLATNLRKHHRNVGSLGSIHAAGPGEIYEIDATGGRIHLVTAGPCPVEIGKPTIYLLIDRWSRFVVSVYMSLKPASYEELRQCLLVAFTSREKRFQALGVNIDDTRWPIGRVPPVICHDRGAEFIGESMRQAAAKDLRIELTPLPPYCPDGKAIVERMIRDLKQRMTESGLSGVYADRPLDPRTKKAARKAQAAAVHSLAEAYRVLIEIVEEHNNGPHTALRKKKVLTQAGIEPTPKAAYLWGLRNISGLRIAPFSDDDYSRMLLATDTASIGAGVLRYKGQPYLPDDETAAELARRTPKRAAQIQIRVDKGVRQEIFLVTKQGEWAKFKLTRGAEADSSVMTIEEEEAFAPTNALLWARAQHSSQVERIRSMKPVRLSNKAPVAQKPGLKQRLEARAGETAALKRALAGRTIPAQATPTVDATTVKRASVKAEWERIEEQERHQNLEIIRQHRRKS